jgi:hypothetical protein
MPILGDLYRDRRTRGLVTRIARTDPARVPHEYAALPGYAAESPPVILAAVERCAPDRLQVLSGSVPKTCWADTRVFDAFFKKAEPAFLPVLYQEHRPKGAPGEARWLIRLLADGPIEEAVAAYVEAPRGMRLHDRVRGALIDGLMGADMTAPFFRSLPDEVRLHDDVVMLFIRQAALDHVLVGYASLPAERRETVPVKRALLRRLFGSHMASITFDDLPPVLQEDASFVADALSTSSYAHARSFFFSMPLEQRLLRELQEPMVEHLVRFVNDRVRVTTEQTVGRRWIVDTPARYEPFIVEEEELGAAPWASFIEAELLTRPQEGHYEDHVEKVTTYGNFEGALKELERFPEDVFQAVIRELDEAKREGLARALDERI